MEKPHVASRSRSGIVSRSRSRDKGGGRCRRGSRSRSGSRKRGASRGRSGSFQVHKRDDFQVHKRDISQVHKRGTCRRITPVLSYTPKSSHFQYLSMHSPRASTCFCMLHHQEKGWNSESLVIRLWNLFRQDLSSLWPLGWVLMGSEWRKRTPFPTGMHIQSTEVWVKSLWNSPVSHQK